MKKEELINDLLGNFKVPENRSKEEVWNEIEILTGAKPKRTTKIFNLKTLIPLGAAACLAIAFLFMGSNSELAYETGVNETQTYTLPDGSSVKLSPSSSLTYVESDDDRKIELQGEAFFQVEKGNPFIVSTNQVQVLVLGTSFNVNARSEKFDVKCFTGKVNVKAAELDVNLTKGLGINSDNKAELYSHSSKPKISINGYLSFDQQRLNSILEDLKIYRNINVKNVSSSNPLISLELQDESVEEIISIISSISSLEVKLVGENIWELY